jgi:hypothetical protein
LQGIQELCYFTLDILSRVVPSNPILLAGQGTRLPQSRTALHLGPGSNAGILLFVREGLTVFPGGGGESATGARLRQGVRILGSGVVPPALL